MTDTTSSPQRAGESGPVLALAADLLFASRIRATPAPIGATPHLGRSAEELLARAREPRPRLVLIALQARAGDPADAIRRLRAAPETAAVPIIAFGPHVRREAIEAARAAGATRVLARPAFVRELPGLLAGPPAGPARRRAVPRPRAGAAPPRGVTGAVRDRRLRPRQRGRWVGRGRRGPAPPPEKQSAPRLRAEPRGALRHGAPLTR